MRIPTGSGGRLGGRGSRAEKVRRLSGVILLAVGLGVAVVPTGAGAAAPPLTTTVQTVIDTLGDVLNNLTAVLLNDGRGDITQASVEYAPGWVRMKMQLRTFTDPTRDRNWESNRTYALWSLDTNGDGQTDYTVEYGINQGEMYGEVYQTAAGGPNADPVCWANSVTSSPQDGYVIEIDPACIGRPSTIGYSVSMFYDTGSNPNTAPVATDTVPNQGFAQIAAPTPASSPGPAPAVTAPPATPLAPLSVKPSPTLPAPAVAAPPAAVPAPTRSAPPPSPKPTAPAPALTRNGAAAPSTTKSSAPALVPATSSRVQPDPGASTELARTGVHSGRAAGLGLGLLLLGVGLLVMTRPARLSAGAF